ncbi:MAG TPA: plastocyanin/azurin family copper-binding protein [Miltoncostaeaceae bacterium]|nr:plastocyanin/azurin family copper-binding protein [Miltoncostaeaceae bacterium]
MAACTAIALTPILAACGDDAEDTVRDATEQVGSVGTEATDQVGSVATEATNGDDGTTGATEGAAPGGQPTVVEIPAAEQGLAFAQETATAPAGRVTLTMPNPSPLPHNIAIDLPDTDDVVGEVVQQGGTSEASAELEAGTYEYYCSVPGHREGGMVGELTVE